MQKQVQFYSLTERKVVRTMALTHWANAMHMASNAPIISIATNGERLMSSLVSNLTEKQHIHLQWLMENHLPCIIESRQYRVSCLAAAMWYNCTSFSYCFSLLEVIIC